MGLRLRRRELGGGMLYTKLGRLRDGVGRWITRHLDIEILQEYMLLQTGVSTPPDTSSLCTAARHIAGERAVYFTRTIKGQKRDHLHMSSYDEADMET
jgi:hypothetical protein